MRKSVMVIVSWAMSLIGFGHFTEQLFRMPSVVIRYAVEKASATLALVIPVAEWKVIERMCSQTVRQSLNVYSRDARSTGSLSSPLLS